MPKYRLFLTVYILSLPIHSRLLWLFCCNFARHTHATMMITLGADLYTVSKLLGHTNIQTTQIYAKIVDESKEKAIDLIPDIT